MAQYIIPPSQLLANLHALGVRPGMQLLVHSSLRQIAGPRGWIPGGPAAVILALEAAVTPAGGVLMPTFTADLSEPACWIAPAVPPAWHPIIRAEMPPFQPDLTITREMGAIPEAFRKQAGVQRSQHPHHSFAAWGAAAAGLVSDHGLEASLGEGSPLARLYDRDGWVLLLGVGHANNSSLHLAEARASWPSKAWEQQGAPIEQDGRRVWVTFQTLAWDANDFPALGAAFEAAGGVQLGRVGMATARLMQQRALVDFGVSWLEAHRR